MEQLRSALGVTRDEVPSKKSNIRDPPGTVAEPSTDDNNDQDEEPLVYTDSSTFLKVSSSLKIS